jgi:hypothetical protein
MAAWTSRKPREDRASDGQALPLAARQAHPIFPEVVYRFDLPTAARVTAWVSGDGGAVDIDRLSQELGIPVVPTTAIRRGGIERLLVEIDRLALDGRQSEDHGWSEPTSDQIRAAHDEAARILKICALAQSCAKRPRPIGYWSLRGTGLCDRWGFR